jgi:hypothetical protein
MGVHDLAQLGPHLAMTAGRSLAGGAIALITSAMIRRLHIPITVEFGDDIGASHAIEGHSLSPWL